MRVQAPLCGHSLTRATPFPSAILFAFHEVVVPISKVRQTMKLQTPANEKYDVTCSFYRSYVKITYYLDILFARVAKSPFPCND